MGKLICTRGLPASGKSTWSIHLVESDHNQYVRIAADDIRKMLSGKAFWQEPLRTKMTETIEKVVVEMVQRAIVKHPVVILDAMMLSDKMLDMWRQWAQNEGVEFEVKSFLNVSLKELLNRDFNRKIPVGSEIIKSLYQKYINEPSA